MCDIQKVSVALTREQVAALEAAVEASDYATTSQILREALREWQFKRRLRQEDVDRLRQLWDASKAGGPAEPFDCGLTIAAARARLRTDSWPQSSARNLLPDPAATRVLGDDRRGGRSWRGRTFARVKRRACPHPPCGYRIHTSLKASAPSPSGRRWPGEAPAGEGLPLRAPVARSRQSGSSVSVGARRRSPSADGGLSKPYCDGLARVPLAEKLIALHASPSSRPRSRASTFSRGRREARAIQDVRDPQPTRGAGTRASLPRWRATNRPSPWRRRSGSRSR